MDMICAITPDSDSSDTVQYTTATKLYNNSMWNNVSSVHTQIYQAVNVIVSRAPTDKSVYCQYSQ